MPIVVRPHLIAPVHKALVIRADDLVGLQGDPPTSGSGPITYQPASRFWALPWLETAVLAALALLLTGFSFWRIRRLT